MTFARRNHWPLPAVLVLLSALTTSWAQSPDTVDPEIEQSIRQLWQESASAPNTVDTSNALKEAIRQLQAYDRPTPQPATPAPTGESAGAEPNAPARPSADAPPRSSAPPAPPADAEPNAPAPAPPSDEVLDQLDQLNKQTAKTQPIREAETDPISPSALAIVDEPVALADHLYAIGQRRAAAKLYQKALKAGPDSEHRDWALFQVANCHRDTAPQRAIAMYQRMSNEFPSSPWTPLAVLNARLLKWQDEADRIKQQIDSTPDQGAPSSQEISNR